MDQTIRFVTAGDGTKLAYAASGHGPPLLKTANWLNHLEFDWESPVWSHWFKLFSRHHTLHRYDIRGSGLSDWTDNKLSFDDQVADLECIADAAGLEKFALLGISQGASVAIEYAVRHPERITHLVIHGGFALGWARRGPESERAGRAWVELVRVGWGMKRTDAYRRMFAEMFIPCASEEQTDWFTEMQRRSTTPELAARIMEASGNIDVMHRLSQVRTPTLVMHPRGDVIVPFEQGRVIAGAVPNARFVEFDSGNHLLLENEPSWQKFQQAVGEFLGWPRTSPQRRAGDRPVENEDLAGLTSREREVLDLVASGANNQDIADRLFISEKTVRNHLTAIFDKIGVSSRSQAIVFARDRGLAGRPN